MVKALNSGVAKTKLFLKELMTVLGYGSGSQGRCTEFALSFVHWQGAHLVGAESTTMNGQDANIKPANCRHDLTRDMVFLPEEVH